ncbi:MAG: AMP-binding protein, partial [Gammaproteobacteria bacterium]|nr:AMP-binding protein [Gammaproteobacteria bacterium]
MDAIIDLLRGEANAPAVSALSRRGITHGELRAQTAALGRQLRAADIGPDDRVALVLPNGPAMAAAFVGFAPWCATAPLNPAYKPDEFAFYLEDLDARGLVVADGTDSVAVEVAKSRG